MKHLNSFFFLFLLTLPTQLGFHLWPEFSLVLGRRIDYFSPTIYLSDLTLTLAIGISVLAGGIGKGKMRTLFLLALGIMGGSGILASFTQDYLYLYAGIRLAEWVLLGWVVQRQRPSLPGMLLPLGVGAIVSSLLAAGQFLAQHSLGGGWYFLGERDFDLFTPGVSHLVSFGRLHLRPYATFSHPNVLGGYLLMVVTLFTFTPLSAFNSKTSLIKLDNRFFPFILKSFVLVLGTLGIFLSFSRSAWMVGAFVLSVFIFYTSPRRQVILFAYSALVLVLLAEEALVGRFRALVIQDQISFTDRLEFARSALNIWRTSPFFGVGLFHFIKVLPEFTTTPYLLQPVHSVYLLLLAETGIAGLGLFILVIYGALRRAWNTHRAVAMALVVSLLLASVDHYLMTLQQTQLLFALLISLAFLP